MFSIDKQKISTGHRPFVIAELSANHSGSIEKAKAAIKAAKISGASAVKMQTYTPDTMTLDSDKDHFKIKTGLWEGETLFSLYEKAQTPFEWMGDLIDYAKSLDVTLFSTPFDESAVDLLESLAVPAFKIASFELTDLPLLERIAQTRKPVLLSTGMASMNEIGEAVETLRIGGARDLLLFHCVSSYPAPTHENQLKNITALQREFDLPVGLSDHSPGNLAAIAAIALGAVAIEKHFKLNSEDDGPDSSFSITPTELSELIRDVNLAWEALGDDEFKRPKVEQANLIFRRSLFFVSNKKAGEIITRKDVRRVRPGYGLNPKFLNSIIGKSLATDIEFGDPVTWDKIEATLDPIGEK